MERFYTVSKDLYKPLAVCSLIGGLFYILMPSKEVHDLVWATGLLAAVGLATMLLGEWKQLLKFRANYQEGGDVYDANDKLPLFRWRAWVPITWVPMAFVDLDEILWSVFTSKFLALLIAMTSLYYLSRDRKNNFERKNFILILLFAGLAAWILLGFEKTPDLGRYFLALAAFIASSMNLFYTCVQIRVNASWIRAGRATPRENLILDGLKTRFFGTLTQLLYGLAFLYIGKTSLDIWVIVVTSTLAIIALVILISQTVTLRTLREEKLQAID